MDYRSVAARVQHVRPCGPTFAEAFSPEPPTKANADIDQLRRLGLEANEIAGAHRGESMLGVSPHFNRPSRRLEALMTKIDCWRAVLPQSLGGNVSSLFRNRSAHQKNQEHQHAGDHGGAPKHVEVG